MGVASDVRIAMFLVVFLFLCAAPSDETHAALFEWIDGAVLEPFVRRLSDAKDDEANSGADIVEA